MSRVSIYITNYCPFCYRAKALLRSKNIDFEEIDVTNDPGLRHEMETLSGRKTVPQIFIDGKPMGGFDDITYLDRTGELDRLLEKPLRGN